MEIRKSTTDDVPAILEIFRAAKAYMAAHGNPTQWGGDYPGLPELLPDIARGDSYVLTENGTVVGTFSFIIGDEPTYQVLLNGRWHADRPYGTIHRLASNGTVRGVSGPVSTFAPAFPTMCGWTPTRITAPCRPPLRATASGNAGISTPPAAPCARPMTMCGRADTRLEVKSGCPPRWTAAFAIY